MEKIMQHSWAQALFSTFIISVIPNVLLYFIPIEYMSKPIRGVLMRNVMMCFAAGGLLGDVFLHTLPHLMGAPHGHSHDHSHSHEHHHHHNHEDDHHHHHHHEALDDDDPLDETSLDQYSLASDNPHIGDPTVNALAADAAAKCPFAKLHGNTEMPDRKSVV